MSTFSDPLCHLTDHRDSAVKAPHLHDAARLRIQQLLQRRRSERTLVVFSIRSRGQNGTALQPVLLSRHIRRP